MSPASVKPSVTMSPPPADPAPPTSPPAASIGGKLWRGLKRIIKLAGLLSLLAIGGVAAANGWVLYSAADHEYDTVEALPARSVAIVLGAGVYGDGTPSQALEDRLSMALDLYQAGKISRVLVSGDHGKRYYDEVNAMSRWLIERGVKPADVFRDHAGFRTFDSMVRARKIFQVEDAVICTQGFHQPRAIFLAREAGIDAVGAPADRRRYADRHVATVRESLARTLAVLDVYVLPTKPKHLGPPIPISGPPQR